ncbi:hypothetical protein OG785_04630 [Streptomyces sp. NBC_00006]|uniref:hypothetical protein n=1 Tax=unclassified Streptomyces TaxID=2593676 RepID=UPI00224CF374|nr:MULTISPECIES: hypothetical protein [unclassified Streptomyces]MCX4834239.1 hypothetical protein [Streptomyces sp. NBC_01016]MCX5529845.1 hypothetical protein [Streptomyces sp. NBC_00006]
MDVLTLVSAFVALVGAATTAVLGYWTQRRLRLVEQRNLMDSYGASLAWAAYDLQSRLYNILRGHETDRSQGPHHGFVSSFHVQGTPKQREFVRRSTVFVLAEYLGWVEILRQDIQFLDLGQSRANRNAVEIISSISTALNRTVSAGDDILRLWRAEQRAIGELMVHSHGEPGRRKCLGYAEFCEKLEGDDVFRRWFTPLLEDIDRLAEDTAQAAPRLAELQQKLINLIDVLDPKAERFPQFRQRTSADLSAGRGA